MRNMGKTNTNRYRHYAMKQNATKHILTMEIGIILTGFVLICYRFFFAKFDQSLTNHVVWSETPKKKQKQRRGYQAMQIDVNM